MTPEQKFFFDLKGWILLPAVLSPSDIVKMKAEVYDGAQRGYEGALQELLDHPVIVGILNEILAEPSFFSKNCYGFRCESSVTMVRQPGWDMSKDDGAGPVATSIPHVVIPPQHANVMGYQAKGGKVFSGLTRVVWELEEVRSGQGATSFLDGSHKAHFNYGGPDPYRPNISESPWEENIRIAMNDYSCPAGSVVIFTESLIHATNAWTNPDNPRCAVFNCYNSLWAQWHRLNLEHQIIENMPVKRRSLFRGTWEMGKSYGKANNSYSIDNRSL